MTALAVLPRVLPDNYAEKHVVEKPPVGGLMSQLLNCPQELKQLSVLTAVPQYSDGVFRPREYDLDEAFVLMQQALHADGSDADASSLTSNEQKGALCAYVIANTLEERLSEAIGGRADETKSDDTKSAYDGGVSLATTLAGTRAVENAEEGSRTETKAFVSASVSASETTLRSAADKETIGKRESSPTDSRSESDGASDEAAKTASVQAARGQVLRDEIIAQAGRPVCERTFKRPTGTTASFDEREKVAKAVKKAAKAKAKKSAAVKAAKAAKEGPSAGGAPAAAAPNAGAAAAPPAKKSPAAAPAAKTKTTPLASTKSSTSKSLGGTAARAA